MTDLTISPLRTKRKQYRPPRNQWLDVWDQFSTHKGALSGWASSS